MEITLSTQVYAYLSGTWTDISADVQQAPGVSARWGIGGNTANDLLADVGTLSFTLSNKTGKYYPEGPAALTGWGYGTKIKLVLTGAQLVRQRFKGRIGALDFTVGDTANESFAHVVVEDWIAEAERFPMQSPEIQTSKRADEGVWTLLGSTAIDPDSVSLEAGDTTFPTIFDSGGLKTTAYQEAAKLVNSEWGHAYIIQHPDTGETLVFESADHRNASHPVKQIESDPDSYILNETGGYSLNETGGKIIYQTSQQALISAGIDGLDLNYGNHIVNRYTVTAYPRRVDEDITVLYSLDNPLPIAAGGTVTFRAGYKDQSGGGAKVNAITSSMLTPEVPGAADSYLKALLHFATDVTDSTGLRTWTQNDVTVENDVYADGYGVQRISQSILGGYGVFGGYANYYITAPNHADFDFGSGAFTIGWYECLLNPAAGNDALARDATSTYPPFLLGASDGTSIRCYMSSNGSSWDIANGRYMGPASTSRWVWYEVSRDSDGWFYAFADGKLTDKWYSATAIPAGGGAFSIGRTRNTNYCYMGFDEFFVRKGECLHKKDFDRPEREFTATLPGDYLMNLAENGTSTNVSSDLAITAVYDSVGVNYSLTNNNASAAYVTYLTARGLGVYMYNPIEESVDDTDSQALYGYKAAAMQQRYQQSLSAGLAKATEIVINEADARTDLQYLKFFANYSHKNMSFFMLCDVGDMIRVSHIASGIIGKKYYIQSVNFQITQNVAFCTYGLRQDFANIS